MTNPRFENRRASSRVTGHARRALALALVVMLGGTGCGTLSVADEKQLGHQAQREVREQFTLMRDRVIVNYVRDLGQRLVQSARPSPFEFRFFVVEDDALNAFAVPGGAIYVNTGLILAANDASELLGVMAHEIGHVTARHVAQNYNRGRATGFVSNVVTILVAILTGSQLGAQGGQVLSGVAAQAFMSSFTREAEREADALCVETMVRGGWDPVGMIGMFESLQKEAGTGFRGPQFLSSHPATPERMDNVREQIASHEPLPPLRTDDGGRLEIIQQRIRLIVGTDEGGLGDEDDEELEDDD